MSESAPVIKDHRQSSIIDSRYDLKFAIKLHVSQVATHID